MENKYRNLKQSDRILIAGLIAIPATILVGIIVGLINHTQNFDPLVLLIGVVSALVYRRVGRSQSFAVAILSIVTTFVGLVVAECVINFGLEGLLVMGNYSTLLTFILSEDLHSVGWTVFRLLSLIGAFSYARLD